MWYIKQSIAYLSLILKNYDQLLLLTINFSVSRSVDNNEVGEVIGREQLLLTHQPKIIHCMGAMFKTTNLSLTFSKLLIFEVNFD